MTSKPKRPKIYSGNKENVPDSIVKVSHNKAAKNVSPQALEKNLTSAPVRANWTFGASPDIAAGVRAVFGSLPPSIVTDTHQQYASTPCATPSKHTEIPQLELSFVSEVPAGNPTRASKEELVLPPTMLDMDLDKTIEEAETKGAKGGKDGFTQSKGIKYTRKSQAKKVIVLRTKPKLRRFSNLPKDRLSKRLLQVPQKSEPVDLDESIQILETPNKELLQLSQSTSEDFFRVGSTQEEVAVGIFWDIENVRVPKGINPAVFVTKVRERFVDESPKFCEKHFYVVCDVTQEPQWILKQLFEFHVRIVHVPRLKANSSDNVIRDLMHEFVGYNKFSRVILISGDSDFSYDMHNFQRNKKCDCVLIYNKNTKESMVKSASKSSVMYKDLLKDELDALNGKVNPGNVQNLNQQKVNAQQHTVMKVNPQQQNVMKVNPQQQLNLHQQDVPKDNQNLEKVKQDIANRLLSSETQKKQDIQPGNLQGHQQRFPNLMKNQQKDPYYHQGNQLSHYQSNNQQGHGQAGNTRQPYRQEPPRQGYTHPSGSHPQQPHPNHQQYPTSHHPHHQQYPDNNIPASPRSRAWYMQKKREIMYGSRGNVFDTQRY